jgi:hypothetical protein
MAAEKSLKDVLPVVLGVVRGTAKDGSLISVELYVDDPTSVVKARAATEPLTPVVPISVQQP